MKKTLLETTDPKGVGLAAPQIGKPLRIFLAKPTDKSKILVFINPEIIARGGATGRTPDSVDPELAEWGTLAGGKVATGPRASKSKEASKKLEGCLSLPNIWGPVLRASSLTLKYQLITNNYELITKTRTFSGFMATIIQHEMDHLEGVLFPKRVLEQKETLYKSHKNKKGEDEFEEIEI